MSQGDNSAPPPAAPQARSHAKIYDRPQRLARFPILLLVGLLILAVVGYYVYRTYFHPPTTYSPQTGMLPIGMLPIPFETLAGGKLACLLRPVLMSP